MKRTNFEFINHTADIGIRVWGKSFAELLKNAACGMYNIICNFDKISGRIKKSILLKFKKNIDYEFILVNFLNELLFLTSVENLVFKSFHISITKNPGYVVKSCCYGETYSAEKHGEFRELKAVTYHNLKIYHRNGKFFTKIFFDV